MHCISLKYILLHKQIRALHPVKIFDTSEKVKLNILLLCYSITQIKLHYSNRIVLHDAKVRL